MMGSRFLLQCAVAGAALMAVGTLPVAAATPKAKAHKAAPKTAEVAPAEATAEQVVAAQRVYYGNYECEFKQTVDIERNAQYPAYVDVKSGKSRWLMRPVVSTTGAVRLEDVKGETLMVQIASKSMLLNVKTSQRVVDNCVCEEQRQLARAAAAAPAAPLLLEGPAATPVATAPGR
jgi:hypothetical protein